MAISTDEFDNFADFGRARLSEGQQLTLEDLVMEWDSHRNRGNVNEAIREGLEDITQGRYRSGPEFMTELRSKYNLPTE